MKINIMDPGLLHHAGHHLDINKKLIFKLAEWGHHVNLYAHAQIAANVSEEVSRYAHLFPIFRAYPYQDTQKIDPAAGELINYLHQSRVLFDDLKKVAGADIWIWPTIYAPQLNACAMINCGVPISACVQTESSMADRLTGSMFWRHAWLQAKERKISLRIGAFEPDHQYEYKPIFLEGNFSIFPSPYDGKKLYSPRKNIKNIGFFGQQRIEKGANIVHSLANSLSRKGYSVIIQDSAGNLRGEQNNNIKFVGYSKELIDIISQCDLVVLPYVPDKYRRKGSGILQDCLASGIPAVVPFDTFAGRWIDRTGAGKSFIRFDEKEILSSIESAIKDYDNIARAAFRISFDWDKHNGIAKFASEMIKIH